jgi:hypothetical protein
MSNSQMSESQEKQDSNPAPDPAPRLDADGLPLDRAPTLDDVRGNAGSGRTIAIGCFVLVAAAILVFWIIRAGLLG